MQDRLKFALAKKYNHDIYQRSKKHEKSIVMTQLIAAAGILGSKGLPEAKVTQLRE